MGPVLGPAIGIGTSLFGGWLGSRQSGQQKEAWGAMKTSMNNLTGAGKQALGYAKDQYNLASPAYGQALTYYQRLLGGNRAQMNLATAGARAGVNDLYRGALGSLTRGRMRGGERDLATAQLQRDRVGKLAQLTTGVQPMAAEALGKLGLSGIDQARGFQNTGVSAFGQAGDIAAKGYDAASRQAQQSGAAWANAGKSIYDILKPKIDNWSMGTPKPGFEQNDKYWNNPDYSTTNPNAWGTPVDNPDMNPNNWQGPYAQPIPGVPYGGSQAPDYSGWGSPAYDNGGGPYIPGTGGYGSAPPGYDPNDPNNW